MFKRIICFSSMFFCSCVVYGEETYWNVYDGTSGSFSVTSVSCESGGDITTPESPYKYGYRFVGWQPAESFDMSTLDAEENASAQYVESTFWRLTFTYGTVYGNSLCSSTTYTQFASGQQLNTTYVSDGYCYCRVYGFVPDGETDMRAQSILRWVASGYPYLAYCGSNCASYCASRASSDVAVRRGLYAIDNI